MKRLVVLTCLSALLASLYLSGCGGTGTRRRPRSRGDSPAAAPDRLDASGAASMPEHGLEPLASSSSAGARSSTGNDRMSEA